MAKRIALLGSNGFVGSYFESFLKQKKDDLITLTRKDCDFLDKDKLYKFIKNIKCDFIINCAGYTGKPNVDACENNKETCWRGNVTLPKYLSDICSSINIKYIQVSSGCIYSGTKGKYGFKEIDEPNFDFNNQPCSYYSGTKSIMEDLLKKDSNAYLCRLRIPFNNITNTKNYITKLLNYNKLLNAENSLTNIDDFVKACYFLITKNCDTGIYNITNTGSINTKEVIKYINKYITNKKFSFFKNEKEFYTIAAKTPRSNCILDNSKLRKAGFKLKHINESIEEATKNYI